MSDILTSTVLDIHAYLRVRRGLLIDDAQATRQLYSNLEPTRTRQIRIALITLISINMFAALLTVTSILYDSWTAVRSKRSAFRRCKRYKVAIDVHPAEVYPLAVSIAIILQGLVFVGVQGTGLRGVMIDRCTVVAQVVWPAVWVVPYVTVVFSLEFVFRSIRKPQFSPRGRWNVLICFLVVTAMLVVTWLPSFISPSQERCIATLVRWVIHFAPIAVIISSTLLLLTSVSAAVLFTQLSRNVTLERDERIAASRMVYHLILTVISMALILPYYIDLTVMRSAMRSALIASFILNLSGISTCLLHLFLRYIPAARSIRPRNLSFRFRPKFSTTLPSEEPAFAFHITSPTEAPLVFDARRARKSKRSPSVLIPFTSACHDFARRPSISGQVASAITTDEKRAAPIVPPPPPAARSCSRSRSKSVSNAYSLFPGSIPPIPDIPSIITSPCADMILRPPRPLFFKHHRRDSSMESSATVQFGLRLSDAPSSMVGEEMATRTTTTTRTPLPPPLSPLSQARSTKPLPPPPPQTEDLDELGGLGPGPPKQFPVGGRRRGGPPWV
ncbi:MAG: hypothetical protein M1837_003005 [Sclerophora amabilis]|nr:MAG: hypothetical protein M1837_003005 [Sclerophora amabilis]